MIQVKAGRRLGSGQTVILNKLSEALHCAGDNGDSIAPCLVYMVTKVRRGGDMGCQDNQCSGDCIMLYVYTPGN